MSVGTYNGNKKEAGIKPCPFCGNARAGGFGFRGTFGGRGVIICRQCGAQGPVVDSSGQWLVPRTDESGRKYTSRERMDLNDAALNRLSCEAWNDRAPLQPTAGGEHGR